MILDLNLLPKPLNFETLFGRKKPVEIEIGVGKGRFMREYALAHPQLNLFGIERAGKWLRHAEERLKKAEVENVRLVTGFAEPFVDLFLENETIQAFHIYFPDPWPKRRHNKRRLFQSRFVESLLPKLIPEGKIHIATDHMEYFESISECLTTFEEQGKLRFTRTERGDFVSNFQAKYEEEGRPIAFAMAEKCTS